MEVNCWVPTLTGPLLTFPGDNTMMSTRSLGLGSALRKAAFSPRIGALSVPPFSLPWALMHFGSAQPGCPPKRCCEEVCFVSSYRRTDLPKTRKDLQQSPHNRSHQQQLRKFWTNSVSSDPAVLTLPSTNLNLRG